nr:EOG090X06BA [Cyclestheria hislopi]
MSSKEDYFSKLIEKITANDATGLQELIKIYNVKIDTEDDHGMTLLQHAAFKGKRDMCQLLLDLGADPNGGHHEHQYTTLHFAALSGNPDICQLFLQHGVKADTVNSVGRTATQMAAEDIDYYTQIHSSEKEPTLPAVVAPALHKFVMQINMHPVHLFLVIQKFPLLYENLSKVQKVLEHSCETQMKRGHESNEILSLKFHHLDFITRYLEKEKQKRKDASIAELLDQIIKAFLKIRSTDGYPEFLDSFVRESIRTFPFKETTVFRQLVFTLSKNEQNFKNPSAISILNSTINGQRGFQDDNLCCTCGEEKAVKKCAKCKMVQYCDKDCQKLHWPMHKKECGDLAKEFEKLQTNKKENTENPISSEN